LINYLKYFSALILACLAINSSSQNQSSKWFFGYNCGLDFTTNPPTVIASPSFSSYEGGASMANAAGNLLFYTDGVTVWNSTHAVMANGSGLMGDNSSTQSSVIVKQPGSATLYFVFTLDDVGGPDGLRYSVVDMSLAAGSGSVTLKNIPLYAPSCEKLTAVKHCNGNDVWIISHENGSANFRSYLLTSAGINAAPVISNTGSLFNLNSLLGCMKVSPNGKKLAVLRFNQDIVELFDFNNATGMVSNPVGLSGALISPYGCEFSPDGTKLYIGCFNNPALIQFNVCAGSAAAINASYLAIPTPGIFGIASLQLAQNGRIYFTSNAQPSLSVINNPNVAGTGCNAVTLIQPVGGTTSLGLPNFMTSFFKAPVSFSFTQNCAVVSFTSPGVGATACGAIENYTATSWSFGDPASGPQNTSTLSTVTHSFSSAGTYTVKLYSYSNCGTDSVSQIISVTSSTMSATNSSSLCSGGSATLQAFGANSYTWSNGATTSSIIVSPTVNSSFTVAGSYTNNCASANTIVVNVSVTPLPSLTLSPAPVICAGTSATVMVSGANTYSWSNNTTGNSLNVAPVTNTVYTVTGTGSAGCSNTATISITVKPVALLAVNSPSVCMGNSVALIVNSIPSAGVTYTWSPVMSNNSSISVTPLVSQNYTVEASYAGCISSAVSAVNVIPTVNPVTSFSYSAPFCSNGVNVFPALINGFNTGGVFSSQGLLIDPLTGEINISGSTPGNYTINYFLPSNGCVPAVNSTAGIVILPAPNLTISNNINILPGASTTLSVSGGPSYTWTPTAYLSCVNCDQPLASPPDNVQYCVSSELNGCTSKKCVDIVVTCEIGYDHSVPNAFTPNGDGHNDVFCLQGWTDCITNFSVLIFDRWGEKVFESTDPSFCWDGIYKGELMNSAVFVYLIKATKKKEQINKKGNITLIR